MSRIVIVGLTSHVPQYSYIYFMLYKCLWNVLVAECSLL
jgi:hypothetical protein